MGKKAIWEKLLSAERIGAGKAPVTPERTAFQQDYDRIVFTSAFRRMKDKTQVFPLSKSDYVRTRLTHSLEVAQIGRGFQDGNSDGREQLSVGASQRRDQHESLRMHRIGIAPPVDRRKIAGFDLQFACLVETQAPFEPVGKRGQIVFIPSDMALRMDRMIEIVDVEREACAVGNVVLVDGERESAASVENGVLAQKSQGQCSSHRSRCHRHHRHG